MQELNLIQKVAVAVVPVMLAITLHEAAHGWVAAKKGDKTALMLGRVTLNPIKHIDPVGTILVPLIMLIMPGGFLFGWAKPVPVITRNLRRPLQDMAWVAVAGPASNLLMALGWALVMKFAMTDTVVGMGLETPMFYMGLIGLQINVILMVLNMLPIPPLDGSRVVRPFLPRNALAGFDSLERYGLIIVLVLLVSGLLSSILGPPVNWSMQQILFLFGI